MNQILSTNNNNNNNNNNKKDMKKTIRTFGILIISIALIICLTMLIKLGINSSKNKKSSQPIISMTLAEETKTVTLKVECKDGIDYIIFNWNDEKETKVNLNGSALFERIIDMPNDGNNSIAVKAVSIKGINVEKIENYNLSTDKTKPTIETIEVVNSKLQIIAKDNKEIDYIEYQWEGELAEKIYATEDDNTCINMQIDIARGTRELKITVADKAGNKEMLSKVITGVNEPEINFTKYGDKVNISVTHDMGFKRIEFLINKTVYVYDKKFSEYDPNKTTVEFDFPLTEGTNFIQVNAYSLEKLSEDAEDELENYSFKTRKGKCTYEP